MSVIPIIGAGLVTMNSFFARQSFFDRQMVWAGISLLALLSLSFLDFEVFAQNGYFGRTFSVWCFYSDSSFWSGHTAKGARSWFDFGGLSFQPSDPVKLIIILILAKYFSRRHIEIANCGIFLFPDSTPWCRLCSFF